ncbi:MAG: hypothetical protein KDI46_03560 [Alphaproteobacteria bacterium]|nr:hypothetical protein [Alphaproteobacteria bacterium]
MKTSWATGAMAGVFLIIAGCESSTPPKNAVACNVFGGNLQWKTVSPKAMAALKDAERRKKETSTEGGAAYAKALHDYDQIRQQECMTPSPEGSE